MSRRNLILAASALGAAVLILAFLTNPDQAAHLKAIKETVTLRRPPGAASEADLLLLSAVQYHNYVIFSTTGFADKTFTYGYFGQIQTTNDIGFFYGVIPQ